MLINSKEFSQHSHLFPKEPAHAFQHTTTNTGHVARFKAGFFFFFSVFIFKDY